MTDERPIQYIIIDGDPVGGFGFCGPFDTHDEAVVYAEQNSMGGMSWWIAGLTRPYPDYERYQRQWVDTKADRVLTFDEVERLGLDGTLRT